MPWRVMSEDWGDFTAETETPQQACEQIANDMSVGNGETVYDGQEWDFQVRRDDDDRDEPTYIAIRVYASVTFAFTGTVVED